MATLDKKVFYEIVDERRLKQLIKSNVIEKEKKALLKGYSKLRTDNGYRVEYNFVKEFYDKGRVYPTKSLISQFLCFPLELYLVLFYQP